MITFKKSESDIQWDLDMQVVVDVEHGQPPYTQWFCMKHFEAAKQLAKFNTFSEAIKILRTNFKNDITSEGKKNLETY